MKPSELEMEQRIYTQLASTALAVLWRRVDGWAMYVGGVPGINHDQEWERVAQEGDKINEAVAKAIAQTRFHPGFEIDLPYCA